MEVYKIARVVNGKLLETGKEKPSRCTLQHLSVGVSKSCFPKCFFKRTNTLPSSAMMLRNIKSNPNKEFGRNLANEILKLCSVGFTSRLFSDIRVM